MNPQISIIIPVYNTERYLKKCLDSIFCQSFKDFEVIVVNDGSTDGSQSICENILNEHSNAILISQVNQGVAESRNVGIQMSHGEYLTFVDSDDYVDEDWLLSFVSVLKGENDFDMVTQGLFVDYSDKTNSVLIDEFIYEEKSLSIAYKNLKKLSIEGFLFNKLYKRRIIVNNNIRFQYSLKEDLLFNLKYLYYSTSMITISYCGYHYVQHGSQSLIHRRYKPDYMHRLIFDLKKTALSFADKCADLDLHKSIIEEYLLSFAVLLISMYRSVNGISDKSKRIKYIQEYHKIRRDNSQIKIRMGSRLKRFAAAILMLPSPIVDLLFKVVFRYDSQ